MDREEQGITPSGASGAPTRASDHDRDGALELLATAASDGRLTLEEYSARADRALAARLVAELTALTADLQRTAQLPEARPEELTAILSNESRKGHWTVPAHLTARSLLGAGPSPPWSDERRCPALPSSRSEPRRSSAT